jgi:hypothetical protein
MRTPYLEDALSAGIARVRRLLWINKSHSGRSAIRCYRFNGYDYLRGEIIISFSALFLGVRELVEMFSQKVAIGISNAQTIFNREE